MSDVRVFDSPAHGDDTPESDLDLLVEPTAQTTPMDIGAIRFELKPSLGIDMDVLAPPTACPQGFASSWYARPWPYEPGAPSVGGGLSARTS